MMKGITAGPMRKQVKDVVEDKLKLKFPEAQDVAAVAAFTYVQSFDDGSELGGVFK